jgi:hypothetical protein
LFGIQANDEVFVACGWLAVVYTIVLDQGKQSRACSGFWPRRFDDSTLV